MSLNPPRASAPSRRVLLASLIASASLLGSAHLAHAGARAWVGPANGNWFSPHWYTSNGSTYVPPDVPPAGIWNNANVDSAIFNFFNSGSLTTTVNNPVTLKSLFFNNVSDENFIIGSNALTFASGGSPGAIGNPGDIGVLYTAATINVPIAGNVGLNLNPDLPYIGKLTLTRVNTFTGPLTIHRGTLELAGAGNLALNGVYNSSSVTVNDGATLLVSGYNGYAGYGANRPPLTINAGGLMTTGDGQTCYVGDITLNGGTLASGTPDVNLGSYYLLGTIIADNNTTSTMSATDVALPVDGTPVLFDIRSSSTLNVTGTLKEIAGYSPGRIEKNGGGTLTLTGANTYTGGTTVTGGTLRLGASDAHPDAASVSIAAATLDVGAGFTDTVGTLDVTDTAATINLGSGAKLAFAASNLVSWTDSLGKLNITGTFVPSNGTGPGTNPGSLRFGTDNTGLTVGQISQIIAPGWTGFGLDPYGYLTARPPNAVPSFTMGADQIVIVNAGPQSISGWAKAISAGPPQEAGQALTFLVTNNNNALFEVQPAVAAGGTLTFTPAADSTGTATVSIALQDNGGNDNGGVDTSEVKTFTITVRQPIIVTEIADSGNGSLRQAIADAAARPGTDIITFSPALSGQTIALGFLENAGLEANAIAVQDTGGVTLDASALPEGITLTRLPGGAVDDHRAFYVFPGSTLTLRGLTLSGFTGSVSAPFGGNSGGGGAIRNDGILVLTRCILTGNTVTNSFSEGGAIFNSRGTLTATQCTFSSNSAQFNGGAISNSGTLTLAQCTFSNNSGDKGGAISNGGFPEPVQLFQCTLSGNTASGGGAINNGGTLSLSHCSLSDNSCRDVGGAILNFPGTLTMENTIVSGNRRVFAGSPNDILNLSSITANSVNLIGVLAGSGLSAGPNLLEGPPQLAPLGNYGGPTQTMPPLPGSPAIDAGGTTAFTTDQRGFPMPLDGDGNGSVIADIGAVEALDLIVRNSNDAGPGSLRQAIANAAAQPGLVTITFAPALSGQTITFGSEVGITNEITLDASSLPGGLTLSGGGITRHFFVGAGANLSLRNLTLAGGSQQYGGAILNNGTLTVESCTFTGNTGNGGGAIASMGSGSNAIVTQCTFTGNTAAFGGALFALDGQISLSHCTISLNTGTAGTGGLVVGGGSANFANNIIAGNIAPITETNKDLGGSGTAVMVNGPNLIGIRDSLYAGSFPAGPLIGTLASPLNPLLAPLGQYGGPTRTMPPLPGSPAIDAAGTTDPGGTDQRGLPRFVSGALDIGAVESGNPIPALLVNTEVDENDGLGVGGISLRDAIAFAPTVSTIIFAPALSGQTITFTSGEIELDKTLTVDGSALASAVQLNGNNTTRLFTIDGGAVVTLTGLTITNCHATSDGGAIKIQDGDVTLDRCSVTGNSSEGEGGAIKIQDGNVTVDRCSFEGNSSDDEGGGIKIQYGSLTVVQSTFAGNTSGSQGGGITCGATDALVIDRCTFSGNESADEGGGIKIQSGTATVNQSTFFGNSSARGGAIQSAFATLTVNQSTISGNSAGPDAGGIWKFSGTLDVINSIVAGNTSSGGAANISGSFGGAASLTTSAPLLAPLGNYGGPTQTMALRPGSPARNAAVGSSIISDQRGFPIVGQRDIGAYEAGTLNSYETWIWETLPTTATTPDYAANFDFDGDGQSNQTEWTALTDPGNGTSRFAATPVRNGAFLDITVPTAPGRTYTLLQSPTLQGGSWTAVGIAHTANTVSTHSFQVPIGLEKMFFQVRVTVP